MRLAGIEVCWHGMKWFFDPQMLSHDNSKLAYCNPDYPDRCCSLFCRDFSGFLYWFSLNKYDDRDSCVTIDERVVSMTEMCGSNFALRHTLVFAAVFCYTSLFLDTCM